MKKLFKSISVLLLAVFVLAACAVEGEDKAKTEEKPAENQEETSEETKEGGYKIGVSLSTLNNPFFVSIREGIEEKAKEEGAEVVVSDAQNDSSVQSNQIEDLITQKVDLIIVNPVDSTAISSSVQKANEANIPVICVDRGSEDGEVLSLVASN